MRRSICYSEPNFAHTGEVKTWKFIYTPSTALPKGTKLKFDMLSKGRDIDWEIPSSNPKKTSNIIYGQIGNKTIQPKEIVVPDSFCPHFEFILPAELKAGNPITILVGSPNGKHAGGTRSQLYTQRRRSFNLYIDPTGKGKYEEPEVFNMDVRGNELSAIRILTPSFVTKNKRFDIVLRFEDEYGNLTGMCPDDTLIELSYEHLRENLNWKIFVPETGFITLPNLYFNEEGIYTIQLLNKANKKTYRSSPIKCFAISNQNLYWGLIHGESERYDSTESIENCLRHFRDDKALNFFGVSPFEGQDETSNEAWKLITQNINDLHEDDRFVTFAGYQFSGAPKEEGVRQILYAKEAKTTLPRKKDPKTNTLNKLFKTYAPKEMIAIPCFTMAKGYEFNFEEFDPDYERVVEIYNSWGSSEQTKKEGNPLPIYSPNKDGVQETAEGAIQKALQHNCRFGFVAGGLDDRGLYAGFYEEDQTQYPPGMTAIISAEHSRSALFEALYNRSCYATTGERIILGLSIAGVPMGKEVSTAEKHGLIINRHITGYVAGTKNLSKVEIIRNGKVLTTFEPEDYSLVFTYDDMTPLDKITINNKDKKPPFVYYYIRVIQEDGHMAWSSPIWIDYVPGKPVSRASKTSTSKTTKSAPVIIEEEEEDFDEEEEDFE